MSANKRSGKWARRKARRALVQAVYQWQMAGATSAELDAEFREGGALDNADEAFFSEILGTVLHRTAELDAHIVPAIDRELRELDNVERAVLRLATCELATRIDVPFRVVIDEYVELTRLFGAEDGHKFVNAVLDNIARSLRTAETGAT